MTYARTAHTATLLLNGDVLVASGFVANDGYGLHVPVAELY